jgi:hypothetical protein
VAVATGESEITHGKPITSNFGVIFLDAALPGMRSGTDIGHTVVWMAVPKLADAANGTFGACRAFFHCHAGRIARS